MTVADLLARARQELSLASFRPAPREASLLLGELLGWSEAQLLARPEARISDRLRTRFEAMLGRRLAGEPVAYILERKEFFGRFFHVDARVLIPRPESEHVVEAVLDLRLPSTPRILDLATGSGCLAVTLGCEMPGSRVVAADNSPYALAVARRNCQHHAVGDRVSLLAADLATSLDLGSFDLVTCNPPYVDPAEAHQLSHEITDFEPRGAVVAPGHGTSVIERLLTELTCLPRSAALVFEIGQGQVAAVEQLIRASVFSLEEIRKDLSGTARTVVARRR